MLQKCRILRPAGELLTRIGRHELLLLVALATIAGGTWTFVELGDEVNEGGTRTIDRLVVLAMRNPQTSLNRSACLSTVKVPLTSQRLEAFLFSLPNKRLLSERFAPTWKVENRSLPLVICEWWRPLLVVPVKNAFRPGAP